MNIRGKSIIEDFESYKHGLELYTGFHKNQWPWRLAMQNWNDMFPIFRSGYISSCCVLIPCYAAHCLKYPNLTVAIVQGVKFLYIEAAEPTALSQSQFRIGKSSDGRQPVLSEGVVTVVQYAVVVILHIQVVNVAVGILFEVMLRSWKKINVKLLSSGSKMGKHGNLYFV